MKYSVVNLLIFAHWQGTMSFMFVCKTVLHAPLRFNLHSQDIKLLTKWNILGFPPTTMLSTSTLDDCATVWSNKLIYFQDCSIQFETVFWGFFLDVSCLKWQLCNDCIWPVLTVSILVPWGERKPNWSERSCYVRFLSQNWYCTSLPSGKTLVVWLVLWWRMSGTFVSKIWKNIVLSFGRVQFTFSLSLSSWTERFSGSTSFPFLASSSIIECIMQKKKNNSITKMLQNRITASALIKYNKYI